MFNRLPTLEERPLFDGHVALVVDNVLADPNQWVEAAANRPQAFVPSAFAYPGPEAELPAEVQAAMAEFFATHIRNRLGGRRTLHATARLSMATLQPHELSARQWFCHRDSAGVPPDQCLLAAVLYLFKDPALGGTAFYRPRRSADATDWLVHEVSTLSTEDFRALHPEIAPGYLTQSNDWFERVTAVEPAFNRIVFYDGSLFHSADLRAPDRLTADPRTGRLTANAFFTCRRAAR
jgi:hypothetical protein